MPRTPRWRFETRQYQTRKDEKTHVIASHGDEACMRYQGSTRQSCLFSRSPNYRAHQSRTQRRRRLIVRGMPQLRQLLRHALRHHVQLALDLRQAVSDVVHQDLKRQRSSVRRGKVKSSPASARAILPFATVQHLQQRDSSIRRQPLVVQSMQTVTYQQLCRCPTPVAHILTRLYCI